MTVEYYYKVLDEYIQSLNPKFREKFSIKQSVYNDIILVLRDGWGYSQFKFWVHKNFKLIKIGDKNFVHDKKSNLPVVTHENLYMKIRECHEGVQHQGRDKTWLQVKSQYSWISVYCVKLFISQCKVCCHGTELKSPILENLTYLQLELIDMRDVEDGEYKWILHIMDQSSKFTWAYSLKSKEIESITEKLLQQFSSFGAPCTLQSSMGEQFVTYLIQDLKTIWSNLTILSTQFQNFQTQSSMDHKNKILKSAVLKWMELNRCTHWSKGLAQVVYLTNTSLLQSKSITPYEIVFGSKARNDIDIRHILSDPSMVDKENLSRDFIARLKNYENQTTTVEARISLNSENLLASRNLVHRTSSDLTWLKVLPSKCNASTISRKRSRSESSSNEDFTAFENVKNSNSSNMYLVHNKQKIQSRAEIMSTSINVKRQKAIHDMLNQHQYQIGNLVSLKIDKMHELNFIAEILPCKIVSVRTTSNNFDTYHLCTAKCIISSSFRASQLLNLPHANFPDISNIDPKILPTMTLEQAWNTYIST